MWDTSILATESTAFALSTQATTFRCLFIPQCGLQPRDQMSNLLISPPEDSSLQRTNPDASIQLWVLHTYATLVFNCYAKCKSIASDKYQPFLQLSKLPGAGMPLWVGDAVSPKWLPETGRALLTEDEVSWSIPTELRFISFILQKQTKRISFLSLFSPRKIRFVYNICPLIKMSTSLI